MEPVTYLIGHGVIVTGYFYWLQHQRQPDYDALLGLFDFFTPIKLTAYATYFLRSIGVYPPRKAVSRTGV